MPKPLTNKLCPLTLSFACFPIHVIISVAINWAKWHRDQIVIRDWVIATLHAQSIGKID